MLNLLSQRDAKTFSVVLWETLFTVSMFVHGEHDRSKEQRWYLRVRAKQKFGECCACMEPSVADIRRQTDRMLTTLAELT